MVRLLHTSLPPSFRVDRRLSGQLVLHVAKAYGATMLWLRSFTEALFSHEECNFEQSERVSDQVLSLDSKQGARTNSRLPLNLASLGRLFKKGEELFRGHRG